MHVEFDVFVGLKLASKNGIINMGAEQINVANVVGGSVFYCGDTI